jgi:hypothetical protein
MQKRLFFIIIGIIIASPFLNIGIITEIFAQKVGDTSFGLSGRSIEEAQGNITELTANKTGFGNESTVGLSGRSIEEANK